MHRLEFLRARYLVMALGYPALWTKYKIKKSFLFHSHKSES